MKLPGKTTPYKGSIFALFPGILALLKEKRLTVSGLYYSFPKLDLGDYIIALDCLYALGKIEIDTEKGTLYYVDADTL